MLGLQPYRVGQTSQGFLKGEVSLYCWPPVWLVWNQLYGNCHFLQNRLIQTSKTGVRQYSDTSPFSIPWTSRLKDGLNRQIRPDIFQKNRFFFVLLYLWGPKMKKLPKKPREKKLFFCFNEKKIWKGCQIGGEKFEKILRIS